jgi:AdoMet dependent proline di-methyltransferase
VKRRWTPKRRTCRRSGSRRSSGTREQSATGTSRWWCSSLHVTAGCMQEDRDSVDVHADVHRRSVVMLCCRMQAATVDGVLGGFGHVSTADIRESERFISKVLSTTV